MVYHAEHDKQHVANSSGTSSRKTIYRESEHGKLEHWTAKEEEPVEVPKKQQKRLNSADHFRSDNQGPTMDSQSKELINNVNNQHRNYPRLDEELNKKRALTKVTTISTRELSEDFDCSCSACARLALYKKLKKQHPTERCKESQQNRARQNDDRKKTLKTIKKSRSTKRNSGLYFSKLSRTKQCSCYKSARNQRSVSNYKVTKRGKRHPSVSTYNSYGSLEHEPMDF